MVMATTATMNIGAKKRSTQAKRALHIKKNIKTDAQTACPLCAKKRGYNQDTIDAMNETLEVIKSGKKVGKSYKNAEDFIKDMLA